MPKVHNTASFKAMTWFFKNVIHLAFSLFNVVTFKNEACRSTESSQQGVRNGTCYTSEGTYFLFNDDFD